MEKEVVNQQVTALFVTTELSLSHGCLPGAVPHHRLVAIGVQPISEQITTGYHS